jgi:hypothetical protein
MLSTTAQIQEPTTGLVFGTPILEGITTWWRLMWQGAAIGIIYTGAFSAMEKNELINSVTGKVKGFGDNIIGAAASAPQLIPIPLPGSAGGNTTVGQLMNRPSQIKQAIQQAGREGKSFKEVFESIKKGTTQQQVLNTQQASKTLQDNATASNNIAKTLGELNGLTGSARDAKLQELIKHMNDANVPNAQRLTSNNVLPELRERGFTFACWLTKKLLNLLSCHREAVLVREVLHVELETSIIFDVDERMHLLHVLRLSVGR